MADDPDIKLHSAKYNALRRMNSDFCNAFPINDLFPSMISLRAIDFAQKDAICGENRTERGRVDGYLSKLCGELDAWHDERFDRFVAVMRKSHKCAFLLKRLEDWIAYYTPLSPATEHDVVKTPSSQQTTTAVASQQSGSNAPTTSSNSRDNSLAGGKDAAKCMRLMRKHVIPRISAEWETVSAFLEYSVHTTKDIRKHYRGDPKQCCTALIEDWISSDNGVRPKTWNKLIEVLSEINELTSATQDIKQCLLEEGIALDVTAVEDTNRYSEEEEYHTPSDLPPSMNTLASNDLYGLNKQSGHEYQQQRERQQEQNTATAAATVTREPWEPGAQTSTHLQVFIMYAKDDDPNGDKVLCFSDVLRSCGVNCDVDIYHANANIPDWSFWVNKAIEHCAAVTNGYILLICSRAMISILEETSENAKVQMVCGHIDRLTLRHLIMLNTSKFIPVFISDHSTAEFVPISLSGKTFYHFPYEAMSHVPQGVPLEEMLRYGEFASLKSLVATLTGQTENPPPHIGEVFPLSPAKPDAPSVKTVEAPPTSSAQRIATHGGPPPTGTQPANYGNDNFLDAATVNIGARNANRPPQDNYKLPNQSGQNIPNQGGQTTGTQFPNQAVRYQGGQHTEFPNQGGQITQFPNQAGRNTNQGGQRAQFPIQGGQRTEFPNQGDQITQFPNQTGRNTNRGGQHTQFPNHGSQNAQFLNKSGQNAQFPNQAGQNTQFPNQGGQITQFPNQAGQTTQFPNQAGQNTQFSNPSGRNVGTEFPIQGGHNANPGLHRGAHVTRGTNPVFQPQFPPPNTGGSQMYGGHHVAGMPPGNIYPGTGGMQNTGPRGPRPPIGTTSDPDRTVPHGLKFRNPNAPPSFAEMDTPKSPTAATGPPGNQIFQGSDLVRNAGQMGAHPDQIMRRDPSLDPSTNYIDFGPGGPSTVGYRHTTSLGYSSTMPYTKDPRHLKTSDLKMVSHQMMPQDHYPEQALPSVSSTIHQQPSSTLEEERLASYDSVNYSNVSSVPHGGQPSMNLTSMYRQSMTPEQVTPLSVEPISHPSLYDKYRHQHPPPPTTGRPSTTNQTSMQLPSLVPQEATQSVYPNNNLREHPSRTGGQLPPNLQSYCPSLEPHQATPSINPNNNRHTAGGQPPPNLPSQSVNPNNNRRTTDVFVSISDKSQQLGSMQRSEQLIAMNQHNMQYGFNAQPYEDKGEYPVDGQLDGHPSYGTLQPPSVAQCSEINDAAPTFTTSSK